MWAKSVGIISPALWTQAGGLLMRFSGRGGLLIRIRGFTNPILGLGFDAFHRKYDFPVVYEHLSPLDNPKQALDTPADAAIAGHPPQLKTKMDITSDSHARAHARTHARTNVRTCACPYARTHARTYERTHALTHASTHARSEADYPFFG